MSILPQLLCACSCAYMHVATTVVIDVKLKSSALIEIRAKMCVL